MGKEEVARKFRKRYGERFISNDVVAFGSGTTVGKVIELMPDRALEELMERIVISTSIDTSRRLMAKGIVPSEIRRRPGAIVDGADSFLSEEGYFIKGGGGALLKEKAAWKVSDEVFVVITKDKIGREFDIPVLVLPEAIDVFLEEFPEAKLRTGGKLPPVINEEGFAILDLPLRGSLEDIERRLDELRPIVIEHGLFRKRARIITDEERKTHFFLPVRLAAMRPTLRPGGAERAVVLGL